MLKLSTAEKITGDNKLDTEINRSDDSIPRRSECMRTANRQYDDFELYITVEEEEVPTVAL